jgi:hypothetical protein
MLRTEDAVQIGNSFITIPNTCNYIHSIISYAVSHLHSSQSYMFVTTITYYTLTRLHWLTSQLSITFSNYHRLYIFTLRNSSRELTPIIHFLRLLLNNWLVGLLLKNSLVELLLKNWLLRHFSSSYIALNRTTARKRPRYCCANRVTCVANRCGATKYKHSSHLLARLTSAFFGSLGHGTGETRFLHGVTRHNIFMGVTLYVSKK